MRALIQRVSKASVIVDDVVQGKIDQGLLILLGVEDADEKQDLEWLCRKISALRIFSDDEGLMNQSVMDIGGDLLVVSQFTLHAAIKKGNRPSFIRAAKPVKAKPMYEKFVKYLSVIAQRPVETGVFGADMKVSLINDGPVTIWMDSKQKE
ncbi:MAG: D-tyrosyl-tRNA(Tyr) deacylase [Saprospiraceae bacterium]|nr:D-tyrosyl-tRNA(Tyr) deacylase [Saprospiraceae bacterium]